MKMNIQKSNCKLNRKNLMLQDKISKNKEWVMVGVYAVEAITGTKTVKRDGFLKMINDCMAGIAFYPCSE